MKKFKSIIRLAKYLSIITAVTICIFFASYNYTHVNLVPDFSNLTFKQENIGPFSFELPETFHLKQSAMISPNITIRYPNYSIRLDEFIYKKNSNEFNDEIPLVLRCFRANHNLFNYEYDPELSKLSPYRAFITSPKELTPQSSDEKYVENVFSANFVINNSGCIRIISYSEKNGSKEERLAQFKLKIIDFFKYYSPMTNVDITGKYFRTVLGTIKNNDRFKIDASITYTDDRNEPYPFGSVDFSIDFLNYDKYLPDYNKTVSLFSDRLKSYIQARIDMRNIFDFRWAYKHSDFNFSPLLSGKQYIFMKASKQGYPARLSMYGVAEGKIDNNDLFDFIQVSISTGEYFYHIPYNYDYPDYINLSNSNYNSVFGYWTKAYETARIRKF